jgi:hypothetical protein
MKIKFRRQILDLLQKLQCADSDLIYHPPNERNPAGTGWFYEKSCEVKSNRKTYGIRLCQIISSSPMQIFIARIEGREGRQNNYHISFSSKHFDEYGLIHASPSFKRCQIKNLIREPRSIDGYPAKVSGRRNKFLVGRLDEKLFPRLFAIVDAKFESL